MNTVLADKQLVVRVYETLEDVRRLVPAWDELMSALPSATPFSAAQWLMPWWNVHGTDQRLTILGFFSPEGTLVGVAPLCVGSDHSVSRRVSRWLGIRIVKLMGDGSGDSEILDLPVVPGREQMFVRTLLNHLSAQSRQWDVCMLNTMPEQSPGANELLKQLGQVGWPYRVYRRLCMSIPLPTTWDSYLRGISSKERFKLNYYSRRLEKHHRVQFYKCCREEDLTACLESLFQLHEMRWNARGGPGRFRSEARRCFYREMSRLFLAKGALEFWFLQIDEKPAATQFGLRYGDTVFQLQEGFDPAYMADSVGFVLRGHVLKQLIAGNVRRYDFLAGIDHHKNRWGANVGTYIDVHFSRPDRRGNNSLRLLHGIKTIKERMHAQYLKKRTSQAVR